MNESATSMAVCVSPQVAQGLRKVLEEKKLWDPSRKLQRSGESVAIPVISHNKSKLLAVLQHYPNAEIKELSLPPSAKSVRKTDSEKLKEEIAILLRKKYICETLLLEIPKKWERHGDLIILPSSSFVSAEWDLLGDELWQTVASELSCKRLARHSTVANDGFRTPQVSILLGNDGEVVHIDNGIKYSFDVTKCMFSSGNISEKLRIASWDCSNETVVDLYAGIGYFTLPYLVHAKAHHVHACEWNPDAVKALRDNLSLNEVEDRCTIHEGDNRQLDLSCVAERVNLGLIPSSEDGWRVAARVLKADGGVLHIHHNVTTSSTNVYSNDHHCFHLTHKEQQQQQQQYATGEQWTLSNVDDGDECAGNIHNRNFNKSSSVCDGVENSQTRESRGTSHCKNRNNIEGCGNYSGHRETGLESDSADLDRKQSRYLPWAREVCERMESLLEEEKGGNKWLCQILHIEKVKSYAPHIDHVILDLRCKLKDKG